MHGIRPSMVAGQPTIDWVLPAFQAVAKNAVWWPTPRAFGMRFLPLKEARTTPPWAMKL